MEKMLQSLLRLRCQTFLEKTYLRNSALNPRTVGRQGRVPAQLRARGRAQQVLSRRFHPKFPGRDIFSSKNGLFFPQPNASCRQEGFSSAAFYSDEVGVLKEGRQWGPPWRSPHPSAKAGAISPTALSQFLLWLLCGFPMPALSTAGCWFGAVLKEKENPELGKCPAAIPHH